MKYVASIFFISIVILCSSCNKNQESYNSMDAFFNTNTKESQFFRVNADNDNFVVGKEGTIVQLKGGSFVDANEQKVTGEILVELKELYSKADLILSNRPTVTTDGFLLESGGVVYVNIMKNYEKVVGEIDILFPTDSPKDDMLLFNGVISDSSNFAWERLLIWNLASSDYDVVRCYIDTLQISIDSLQVLQDSINERSVDSLRRVNDSIRQNAQDLYFYRGVMQINSDFDWINVDRFLMEENAVSLSCYVSDTKNLYYQIFFVLDSIRSVIDLPMNCSREIPVGYKGKIIAIGVDGKKRYYFSQDVELKNDMNIDIRFEKIKESELLEKIQNLN
ncbi:MAG: hypothetical protein PF481_03265 [Bacteroidales bacterium]|jgi:hypothetical protein|nr:hypothetical protein [Bacteroidales bacterium]